MAVAWDASYETGNAAIDEEHRRLLAVVDELESTAVDTHRSEEVILGVLSHLMDCTLEHFSAEERLMEEREYPIDLREQMVEQHNEFISYARLRVLEFRSGGPISVLSLQKFLAHWLIVHEFGLDVMFADFVRARDEV